MKSIDQNGSGVRSILLFIAVIGLLGLVGLIGWFAWGTYKPAVPPQSSQNTAPSPVVTDEKLPQGVTLKASKLPSGWSVNSETPGSVQLLNTAKQCNVDVIHTTKTIESYSPDLDHKQRGIDAMKSKGYTVEELPAEELSVVTQTGLKPLDAFPMKVTADGKSMSQIYAYHSTKVAYAYVQLSCSQALDLPEAKAALTAVRIDI